jgi:hypothetical protein
MDDGFIERKIIIGMIVSTEFLQKIQPIWNPKLIQSLTVKRISGWCLQYFSKYNKAPSKQIEIIFSRKIKSLSKDMIEDIEETLASVSKEYERNVYNAEYLYDQAKEYLHTRRLLQHAEQIQDHASNGELTEAENLAVTYKTELQPDEKTWIDPFEDSPKILKQAFEERPKPLIKFGGALGQFWGDQFYRDGFVALLGPEKRGKTFMLMDIAYRGVRSGCNVAVFQAGDMSERQQLSRLCTYLTGKSNLSKYCNQLWVPQIDCMKNQLGTCKKEERKSTYSLWEKRPNYNQLVFKDFLKEVNDNTDYTPCNECTEYRKRGNGAFWLYNREAVNPLTWTEVRSEWIKFNSKYPRRLRLATYANETLTIQEIKSLLDTWETKEGLVFDIIIIDYADLLRPDPDCAHLSSRDQYNKIWQRMRRLSQERHCLVVTATQASASSYGKTYLKLADFSEDKRKYAHVTAMYGLNQTDEEKKLGLMRFNELVVRDGDSDQSSGVYVIGRLQMGRPIIGSFW